MDFDTIEVTTFEQAKFHLIKGEIIAFALDDGFGYIRKIKDNTDKLEIIIQPNIGQSKTLDGNFTNLQVSFKSLSSKLGMYVIKGAELIRTPATRLDKIADFFRELNRG